MNAFSSSRLNRPPTIAAAVNGAAKARQQPISARNDKSSTSRTTQHTSTSSAQSNHPNFAHPNSTSSKLGGKRKRETDALFAASSDEEESDHDEHQPDPRSRHSNYSTSSSSTPVGSRSVDVSSSAIDDGPRKKSRNAPEEMSSKKKVAAGLVVTALPNTNIEKKRRDPRFDPLCGTYDPLHFHAHYDWMNGAKSKEISEWRGLLSAGRGQDGEPLTEEEKEEIKRDIQRAQQQIQMATRTKSEKTLLQQWKHQERSAQKDGKKPFFLKKSEEKKLALAARFMDLKSKKGALAKFMVKKTKDIKNKDHKYMPREGREE